MAENENKQENVVVEDFKRTNAKKSKKKFRHRQQNPVLAFYEDNKQYLLGSLTVEYQEKYLQVL